VSQQIDPQQIDPELKSGQIKVLLEQYKILKNEIHLTSQKMTGNIRIGLIVLSLIGSYILHSLIKNEITKSVIDNTTDAVMYTISILLIIGLWTNVFSSLSAIARLGGYLIYLEKTINELIGKNLMIYESEFVPKFFTGSAILAYDLPNVLVFGCTSLFVISFLGYKVLVTINTPDFNLILRSFIILILVISTILFLVNLFTILRVNKVKDEIVTFCTKKIK